MKGREEISLVAMETGISSGLMGHQWPITCMRTQDEIMHLSCLFVGMGRNLIHEAANVNQRVFMFSFNMCSKCMPARLLNIRLSD